MGNVPDADADIEWCAGDIGGVTLAHHITAAAEPLVSPPSQHHFSPPLSIFITGNGGRGCVFTTPQMIHQKK